jgi:hypothetical protein
MATDSALSRSVDPPPAPVFGIAALDMTGVGWSLRVACQIAVDDRSDGYCRLPVGHGGAHQAGPAQHDIGPAANPHRPSTVDGGDGRPAAIWRAGEHTSALVWQVPERLLRPR